MAKRIKQPGSTQDSVDLLAEIIRQGRLVLKLLLDNRVPAGVKLIPLLTLLYVVMPLDMIPDPILGLGQVDDLVIVLIGLNLFIRLSPSRVVEQHRGGGQPTDADPSAAKAGGTATKDVIEGTYRVIEGRTQAGRAEEDQS